MFGFFRKKRPANTLEEFIFAVYGNPPPQKRADLEEAITIATDEILMGLVERREIQRRAEARYSGPVPYSTHDLALSVATDFYTQPEYIRRLGDFQMIALLQAIHWFQQGLVVPVWVEKFEKVLSRLYKSEP